MESYKEQMLCQKQLLKLTCNRTPLSNHQLFNFIFAFFINRLLDCICYVWDNVQVSGQLVFLISESSRRAPTAVSLKRSSKRPLQHSHNNLLFISVSRFCQTKKVLSMLTTIIDERVDSFDFIIFTNIQDCTISIIK